MLRSQDQRTKQSPAVRKSRKLTTRSGDTVDTWLTSCGRLSNRETLLELDSKALKQLSDEVKPSKDYRIMKGLGARIMADYRKKKQLKQRQELVRKQVLERKELIRQQTMEMSLLRRKHTLKHDSS